MSFVFEVNVEAGPRNARFGRQPVHAELGESGPVAHEPFGGVQQPVFQLLPPLLAVLLAIGLRLTGDRRHLCLWAS